MAKSPKKRAAPKSTARRARPKRTIPVKATVVEAEGKAAENLADAIARMFAGGITSKPVVIGKARPGETASEAIKRLMANKPEGPVDDTCNCPFCTIRRRVEKTVAEVSADQPKPDLSAGAVNRSSPVGDAAFERAWRALNTNEKGETVLPLRSPSAADLSAMREKLGAAEREHGMDKGGPSPAPQSSMSQHIEIMDNTLGMLRSQVRRSGELVERLEGGGALAAPALQPMPGTAVAVPALQALTQQRLDLLALVECLSERLTAIEKVV